MNLTVVLVTHKMAVVRDVCSYVAVIDSGKVVECGSVVDIFAHPKADITKDFIADLPARPDPKDTGRTENV